MQLLSNQDAGEIIKQNMEIWMYTLWLFNVANWTLTGFNRVHHGTSSFCIIYKWAIYTIAIIAVIKTKYIDGRH